MNARLLLLGAVLVFGGVAACTGLHLDNPNAWPCDYAAGPGARDAACHAGDVCGLDNLCHPYLYEGPRFEGTATVPSYGPGSHQGELLHPLVLDEPLVAVARQLPFNSRDDSIWARTESGRFVGVSARGQVLDVPLLDAGVAALSSVQPLTLGGQSTSVLRTTDGALFLGRAALPSNRIPVDEGAEVRFLDSPPQGLDRESASSFPVVWTDAGVIGFVIPEGAMRPRVDPFVTIPGVLDVAGITLPERLWVAALTATRLQLNEVGQQPDAGREPLDDGVLELSPLPSGVLGGRLRTDRQGRIIAAVRATADASRQYVLSTWQVSLTAEGPQLTQPWPDCAPCRAGEELRFASASVASGAPVVEVACRAPGFDQVRALRVVGSVALSPTDACRTERFEPPFPLERVNAVDAGAVAWGNQVGLVLGGRRGEVWQGETLSGMQPLFLDRVPRDVAPVQIVDNAKRVIGGTLAAIADEFLTVLETPLLADGGTRLNGFRRVDERQLGVSDDEHLLAFVHDTPGWGVTTSGDVVKSLVGLTSLEGRTGPRLVAASGAPIRGSIGGEAFNAADGSLQAFFVAADDGLYFVRDPRSFVDRPSTELVELTPELTPEPSVPIRSLALERTPLGTDGVSKARGYLVTSRNVYAWQLGGQPARWSATQLLLGGGEPVEVWFDSSRSALGRVGFRDGEVYSLPGGYLLAEAIPGGDAGTPPQVLDFENLGGWPVAFTTTGLFVAGWDLVGERLQNRFADGGVNRPMSWRRITLPDGGEPWLARPAARRSAKLFVAVDPYTDAGLQPHRLLLFLDDQVLQVAEHSRK
ncbi:MAG: hypothetical protein ACOZQL_14090 [Myxococcota bacterium]